MNRIYVEKGDAIGSRAFAKSFNELAKFFVLHSS